MDELGFIAWMRQNGAGDLSDDCAEFASDAVRGPLVVTTDMLLDGTHFDLAEHGPQIVGRKAVACSLSDIAAMGCRPAAAFCSVGLPRDFSSNAAKELFHGAKVLCDEFAVTIAGGDTTSWTSDGRLAICVTMIGWADGLRPIRRSGAQPGDSILVTGRLGGSILGRHLSFQPRVAEGRFLAQQGNVHAMIDISDGLALDLFHIVTESRCGATINARAVPVSSAAAELARRTGKDPIEHALHDGEDFELLFTLPPAAADALVNGWPFATELTRIGRIEPQGLSIVAADGSSRPLPPGGYVHQFGREG